GLFLITMALAVLFRASGRRGPWAWLAAGAALGLAALTRGNLLLLVPLFGLWILLAFAGSLRTRLAGAALFVLGFVLMISPVTLHNWLAGRDLVLLTSQAGQNFYIGNNPRASGFFEHPDRIRLTPEFEEQDFRQEALRLTGRSDMRPSEVSSFWMRRGLDYALTHPGRTLKRLWIKTVMFFNDFEIPDNYNLYFARQQVRFLRFLPLSFGLIASLGLVGLAMLWPDRRRFWLPAIFLAGYLISIVPFHMASRYRLPVVTILIALAAFFVARLVAMLRERNWPAAAKMAAPAAVLLVLCHWPMYDPAATFDAPYMALGLAEADAGRPEQALRLYWSALDVNPDFAPAYYNLGNAFLALERYDRAESAFSRAIELDPYLVQAYLNLGSLYLDRDRTREAQQTFRSALTRLPRSAEAWLGLGLSLHKQGIYNQAIDAFTSALQIAPGLAAAHYNLACALARSGRPEAAWPHLKTAARLDPSLAAQAAEDPDLLSLGQGDDMRKRLGEQS
ncbi:MAG: tetratricopeptide repeat protein, partial [Proteobacteria bacterium]|nr:tetratricopeptide repeat protein [Pseudomonadota bacterium]